MKIAGDWLGAPGLQRVLACLTAGGHRALMVGGCVRNAILGLPVADIDIATDAPPARVAELAAAAGLKVVPTGIDHGTVTLVADGVPHEVTTFRRDVETDGRRAVVAFSDRLEEDAARRDFTMNALYAGADGTVIDPLGGLPDLLARRVRFVGLPEDRIREDYLRILRFFRFHANYGDPAGGLDAEGLAACAANSAGIETLSRERIGHELRRLLAAADPAPAVAAMRAAGILARVLPGSDPRWLAVLVHLEEGLAPGWLRRLAVLGGEDPAEALRLSRDEARRLVVLRTEATAASGPGELGWRHGLDAARDVVLLRAALSETPVPAGWRAAAEKGAGARFPVRAADLPQLSGPALGARLKELEARWIASDFELSRAQLLA
ncbi:MAG: CCA tRNA nucleotidyltransferase [Paracoccaceae bacterium]